MTSDIFDFHTHHPDATSAIISVHPSQFDPQPGKWYSVGIHPWDTVNGYTDADLDLLKRYASHPQVLAIGETGMDSLRGAELDLQAALFIRHLQLAHAVGKPVVVHTVRTSRQILDARRQAGLNAVPLVIHGMRGNEHVARVLLDAGCCLSFGPHFNTTAVLVTPSDRLLIETDDTNATIDEVATLVAQTLGQKPDDIKKTAADNARRLLSIHS